MRPAFFAVEGFQPRRRLGLVGPQDQREEIGFLRFELFLLFLFSEIRIDANKVLPFVLAEVEDFEGAVGLVCGLALALHADQAFARGVDGEFSQIADDPFSSELLRHRRRSRCPC
jgi:hypothetical protein